MIKVICQVNFKLDGQTRQQIFNGIRIDQYKQTFRDMASARPSKTVCNAVDSFHMRAEFEDPIDATLFDMQFRDFVKTLSGVDLP